MQLMFDDVNDQFWAGYSLDGQEISPPYPFGPDFFSLEGEDIWEWGFQAGSLNAVPLPAAAWLFASALGIAGFAFNRRRAH
jgi:hypothetical protein